MFWYLTTNGRVGIDVEEIKPVNKDIMHYALSKQEFHIVPSSASTCFL
ncbi:hypothetical protein AABM34_22235 [Lysinibacillus fusiformis]